MPNLCLIGNNLVIKKNYDYAVLYFFFFTPPLESNFTKSKNMKTERKLSAYHLPKQSYHTVRCKNISIVVYNSVKKHEILLIKYNVLLLYHNNASKLFAKTLFQIHTNNECTNCVTAKHLHSKRRCNFCYTDCSFTVKSFLSYLSFIHTLIFLIVLIHKTIHLFLHKHSLCITFLNLYFLLN